MALSPFIGEFAANIASTKQLLAHAAIIIAIFALLQLGGSDAASTAFAGTKGATAKSLNSGVWIDTGCTKSVFNNPHKLINVCPTQGNYVVQGVAGQVRASGQGDFPLSLRDNFGVVHERLVTGCLIADACVANLLATEDLRKAGIGLNVPSDAEAPVTLNITTSDGTVRHFDCLKEQGLYKLPFFKDAITYIAGIASHQLRALTQMEIWHLRTMPASISAQISNKFVSSVTCFASSQTPTSSSKMRLLKHW
jgi:hypothetical protein